MGYSIACFRSLKHGLYFVAMHSQELLKEIFVAPDLKKNLFFLFSHGLEYVACICDGISVVIFVTVESIGCN